MPLTQRRRLFCDPPPFVILNVPKRDILLLVLRIFLPFRTFLSVRRNSKQFFLPFPGWWIFFSEEIKPETLGLLD